MLCEYFVIVTHICFDCISRFIIIFEYYKSHMCSTYLGINSSNFTTGMIIKIYRNYLRKCKFQYIISQNFQSTQGMVWL